MFDDPEASRPSHHNSQRMEILILAIVLTLAGAQQRQFEGPKNTLSIVGSYVTLKCSSSSMNCSGIDWQKARLGGSPMTIFKGPRTILSVVNRDRYSVDNSSGCDLIIRNVQLSDAGRFICSAIINSNQVTKTAYLIVGLLESQPTCTLSVSLHDPVEGDGVQLNCTATYIGQNRVSMTWKGVTDAPAAVKNGNTLSRSYSVVASVPEVPSFTCVTSFASETDEYGVSIEGLATNRLPTVNANCSTSAIRVLYSVRNVTLSPSLSKYPHRNVINCTAKGQPSPTFKWQETENSGTWIDIQSGFKFTKVGVSSKQYRCVAMNVVRGSTYSSISPEIQFSSTDDLSTTSISASDYRLGLYTGVGIGIIGIGVAILLTSIVFAMLVRNKYLELHPSPAVDGVTQHQDQEMSPSSHQRSATPRTRAPIVGEQESTYAGLGEDRDANEYASLEQKQKAKPGKKSRP